MSHLKLSSPEYAKLRWQVFVLQDYRCADCGRNVSFGAFELHHQVSRGFGGGFRDDSNVRGLCGDCHREADKHRESKFR